MNTATFTPEHIKRWTMPDSYAGAEWPDYYVFLGRHRDSDALTRANFDAGLKAIGGEQGELAIAGEGSLFAKRGNPLVAIVSENHWAVGWVEWIAIHESATQALQIADKIKGELEDYPVVDEELWSQYEHEETNETWKNCFDPMGRIKYIREHRRQFEFHDFADLLACVRGNYFAGYASELIN